MKKVLLMLLFILGYAQVSCNSGLDCYNKAVEYGQNGEMEKAFNYLHQSCNYKYKQGCKELVGMLMFMPNKIDKVSFACEVLKDGRCYFSLANSIKVDNNQKLTQKLIYLKKSCQLGITQACKEWKTISKINKMPCNSIDTCKLKADKFLKANYAVLAKQIYSKAQHLKGYTVERIQLPYNNKYYFNLQDLIKNGDNYFIIAKQDLIEDVTQTFLTLIKLKDKKIIFNKKFLNASMIDYSYLNNRFFMFIKTDDGYVNLITDNGNLQKIYKPQKNVSIKKIFHINKGYIVIYSYNGAFYIDKIINNKVVLSKEFREDIEGYNDTFKVFEDKQYFLLYIGTDSYKGILIKIDKNGNILWEHKYNDILITKVLSTNDSYLLAGKNEKQLILIKTNKNGNIIWRQQFNDIYIVKMFKDKNGYVLVGGKDTTLVILKVNKNGKKLWKKELKLNNLHFVGVVKKLNRYFIFFDKYKEYKLSVLVFNQNGNKINQQTINTFAKVLFMKNIDNKICAVTESDDIVKEKVKINMIYIPIKKLAK